jgi:phosphoserine phosphatase
VYGSENLIDFDGPQSQQLAKYRLVAFDLDGTLLRGLDYSWTLVWKFLGYEDDIRDEAMRKFLCSDRSFKNYTKWCDFCCKKFVDGKLRYEDFKEIVAPVTLTNNFYPTMEELKRRGYVLALISGGINRFLYETIPDAARIFDYIHINVFKFAHETAGILTRIIPTEFDFFGKAKAVKNICQERGFDCSDAVFVGGGVGR